MTGHATVPLLAGLAIVYGLADGFVLPASQGLIPLVVSRSRLQQANALLGLSRSLLGFLAPAIGGLLVTLGSPGSAILVDAASFAIAAALLFRLSVPQRGGAVEPERFLDSSARVGASSAGRRGSGRRSSSSGSATSPGRPTACSAR